MKQLLLVFLLLIPVSVMAQSTTFTPFCLGSNDTAAFNSLITVIGSNAGTIKLPYKNGARCAVNTLTIPANITLDNSQGTGISVNITHTLTVLGPVINIPGKAGSTMFFGPGTVSFVGNVFIGTNSLVLTSDGVGGTSWTVGGGGGGGSVTSVFGRTGDVVAATNDYTWAQINKSVSSLADLATRSADELSNGTTGTGQVVLHDSPVLITPTLGAATATTINGITITSGTGTLTMGSFTGTMPATGTFALGADTLSVSSTNATGASHTHAVTTSSNPGATESILASNASGYLQLLRLGIGVAPTQPLEVAGNIFVNAATANLFLKDTSTGLQSASSGVITPQNNNSVRSTNYTAGTVGWNINAAGDAEFNNLTARGEIRSSVFKVNEIAATAGTLGVFFSAAALSADAVIPASGNFGFDAENSDTGGMLFGVGDIVRFKGLSSTGVSDTWATIIARVNNGTTTTYTAALNSGTASTTFTAGTAVVDYGPSGTGFITLSTDGTVGASPNLTMATHAGSPWSALTTRLRTGNLNGSYGYATNIYGFGVGQYGTAGQSWLTVDPTNGVRIGNNTTTLTQVDAAGNASFTGSVTASSGTIAGWSINPTFINSGTTYIASGFNRPGSGPFVWFGKEAGALSGWEIRDSSDRFVQAVANVGSNYPYLSTFDGTRTRVVIGGLNFAFGSDGATASVGMKVWNSAGGKLVEFSDVQNIIAGWSLSTTELFSGTGSNTVGLSSASTGADDVRIYAGNATPTSAPFRVTEAGVLTASNANITGAITATSGAFTGDLTAGQSVLGPGGLVMTSIGTAGKNSVLVGAGLLWKNQDGSFSDPIADMQAYMTSSTSARLDIDAYGKGGTATNSGTLRLTARNAETGVHSSVLNLVTNGTTISYATFSGSSIFRGVTIGSTSAPTASAILDLNTTTGAVLFPRLTTTERDALTPTNGMVIYNSSTNKLQVRAAGAWVDLH